MFIFELSSFASLHGGVSGRRLKKPLIKNCDVITILPFSVPERRKLPNAFYTNTNWSYKYVST
jgi:hypothetical protein